MSKVQKYPVKKKHYREFKAHFRHAAKVFGISDWEIRFCHRKLRHKHLAEIQCDPEIHVSWVSLGTCVWGKKASRKLMRGSAMHEFCHLLTAPIATIAHHRYVTHEQLKQAAEVVTIRLTNVLTPILEQEDD